ncbi:MAG: hypothetical protein M1820_006746 [Bogoriella megaspora]|nr:MAG: hypothetical protein M1820_006746 [Bogoriella megaspora]
MEPLSPEGPKRPGFRSRTSFKTRAAEDTNYQLDPRLSLQADSDQPVRRTSSSRPRRSTPSQSFQDDGGGTLGSGLLGGLFSSRQGRIRLEDDDARAVRRHLSKSPGRLKEYKPPRPSKGTPKLGTFDGVFVPVSLNVLSILMFLRFGFILGQCGFLLMIGERDYICS